MGFISSAIETLGPAEMVLKAILGSLLGILLLVGFIVLRRWYRGRYFRRKTERTIALRAQWDDIVSGKVPPHDWRFDTLDCDIVESILLDSIEMGTPATLPSLLQCLRKSGLLDMRVCETRVARGWNDGLRSLRWAARELSRPFPRWQRHWMRTPERPVLLPFVGWDGSHSRRPPFHSWTAC